MKKLIIIACLFSIIPKSYGQIIQNGNFAINNGNYQIPYTGGGCNIPSYNSFIDGSIPNWYVSHGSPQLYNWPTLSDMFFFSDNSVSEGITGGYPFLAGETYIVHVGVESIYAGLPVRMVATATRQYNANQCTSVCDPNLSGYVNGTPPVPSNITTSSSMQELTVPSLHAGDNQFTFSPSYTYNWIMIFPSPQSESCHEEDLILKYVQITRQCKESIYLTDLSTASGTITYYKNIYAGSVYGSTYNTPTTVPGSKTFEASQQITLSDNFIAAPSGNNFFLAQINPYACDIIPGLEYIATLTASNNLDITPNSVEHSFPRPADALQQIDQKDISVHAFSKDQVNKMGKENVLEVYPNPAKDQTTLSIDLTTASILNVQITDMLGRLLSTQIDASFEAGNQQIKINTSSLQPGTYSVRVKVNDKLSIIRLSIIK